MERNYKALRNKAVLLRRRGFSYGEIGQEIPVSKSTLSLWLHTVPLRPKDRQRLYTKQIQVLARGPRSQKERRAREISAIIDRARAEIRFPLTPEAYKLFGVALYWAEGSKKKNFEITNSDPHLILFMVRWLEKVFGLKPQILKARLNIYPQQNDLKIKHFWSKLTHIPVKNFGKSFVKPANKGYKKNNLYYGTIKIYIPKGTDMKLTTFGWLKAVLQDISEHTESTQKHWQSLREVSRAVNV